MTAVDDVTQGAESRSAHTIGGVRDPSRQTLRHWHQRRSPPIRRQERTLRVHLIAGRPTAISWCAYLRIPGITSGMADGLAPSERRIQEPLGCADLGLGCSARDRFGVNDMQL